LGRRRADPNSGQVPAGTPAAREGFDMRRHGWALCLGAFLTGLAAAQPPANEERYPPAPDLPGQVVGQIPTAPVNDVKDAKPVAPPAGPLPDAVIAPYNSTATATVAPVGPAATAPCPAPAARSGCHIGIGDLTEWLCFQSKARQSGHFVTPYRPPLFTWFPCEPKRPPCGVGPVIGAPVNLPPAVLPAPDGALPAPGTAGPTSTDPALGGGVTVGKCLDAEVLTTFQPVAPGIGFTPGVAPMANPTTQIKPTSFKPK
jgi:hypothetical protein